MRAASESTAPGCTHLKLRRAVRCLGHHYDAYTAAVGLKTTQYSLLSAILRREPVQPAALAASLNLDASTLTRNLRPLLAHGWVELLPGLDARSRRIVTTAAGRALRLEAHAHWKVAQQALIDRLGATTVAQLHDLLDRVLDEFGEAPPAASAPRRGRSRPSDANGSHSSTAGQSSLRRR